MILFTVKIICKRLNASVFKCENIKISSVGYSVPNPVYTYILNIHDLVSGFYDISTIVGYLMSNLFYTYKI